MITSNLGGGIYCICIFSKWQKRRQKNQKVAYLSKYCFDVDDVYTKLYVFRGADAIYDVPEEGRGHADV